MSVKAIWNGGHCCNRRAGLGLYRNGCSGIAVVCNEASDGRRAMPVLLAASMTRNCAAAETLRASLKATLTVPAMPTPDLSMLNQCGASVAIGINACGVNGIHFFDKVGCQRVKDCGCCPALVL
jgi:hypothetical protein